MTRRRPGQWAQTLVKARTMARRRADRSGEEAGFGLVEVLVASVVLLIVLISITNLLTDSLTAALLSQQREAAASLASDTIENAQALGQTALTAASTMGTSCAVTTTPAMPVPVLSTCNFLQSWSATVDGMTYTVTATLTTGAPDTVTVVVNWGSSSSYVTSTQVGT
jgi:Tfp pilus assembly protein PilV